MPLMTGESEPVRSAVTRLKLASNNGLLVDDNTIRCAIFMTQTDLSTSAFWKDSLKTTNNVITVIARDADGLGPVNLQYTEYQDDLATIERLDNSIGHIKRQLCSVLYANVISRISRKKKQRS